LSQIRSGKTIRKMKKGNITVDQFKKLVAGGLTIGTVDDIINRVFQYVNVGVNHFIFHFFNLDQSALKKFSKVIKECKISC